jgi:hypothetical protein
MLAMSRRQQLADAVRRTVGTAEVWVVVMRTTLPYWLWLVHSPR